MFDICTHDLSQLFWRRLLRLQAWSLPNLGASLRYLAAAAERDRAMMNYQTGSIPFATAAWLAMLADHLKPKIVVEVGTFVGKSTAALALGMAQGKLWTCDKDNDAPTFLLTALREQRPNVDVRAFPGRTSTEMLAEAGELETVDLFFWDGRVQPTDREYLERLSNPNTVWAFDDFEGTEKGVANVSVIRGSGFALIEPPAPDLLEPFGIIDRSTLALLVPIGLFRFTAQ